MTIMKGWKDRQEAAKLRHQHVRVDASVREQRALALAEAKAATARATEVYDIDETAPVAETDEPVEPAAVIEDDENDGALVEGDDDAPAQPIEEPADEPVAEEPAAEEAPRARRRRQ